MDYNRNLRKAKRQFMVEILGDACTECGDDRPGAIDYHHPNPVQGKRVPLTVVGWEVLKEEIMHLIALCGACHNVHHRKVA